MTHLEQNLAEYIVPLNMNGLQGRMLRVPAHGRKKRDILLIYGHHATLERSAKLVNELAKYGSVTVPDLPGFGGMESLYKLHDKPTLNRLADYTASFIKLRYRRRRLTIVGVGFGFVIITRMLQRYPDLVKKIDFAVSLGGFAHYDDFSFNNRQQAYYRRLTRVYSWRLPAFVLKHTVLPTQILEKMYKTDVTNDKLRKLGAELLPGEPADDVIAWTDNDLRTHMLTISAMLSVDNCITPINLPVWHAPLASQQYLNKHIVDQHLRIAFKGLHSAALPPARKKNRRHPAKPAPISLSPALRRALARPSRTK
ncbi:MAG TPA: hypothetical protein VMR28_01885 [Candidatus Saccharimonadales bacterium]|nr:hypothetical protein [Candidatus Saccharimonadales bacterium]